MTKKHFEAIASALAKCRPSEGADYESYGVMLQQWKQDCRAMAMVCAIANRNFNSDRFYLACGFTG